MRPLPHFFYGSYAWLFVIGLLLLTALATEIGYTAGRRDQWVHPEGAKGQVTAITAGALGVLALLMRSEERRVGKECGARRERGCGRNKEDSQTEAKVE